MLEFVLGRACTGKSYSVLKSAAQASLERKTIIIVPEQFSFETERAIIKFENAIQENISVLSFTKLYDAVIEYSGRGNLPYISDFEKNILVSKALKNSVDNLEIFSKFVDSREFTKKISETIRNLKYNSSDFDSLLSAAREIGGVCGAKLHDIAVVMSVYDSLLADKLIDPADRLTKLYEFLRESDFFTDSCVFFDSFTGFTGQQYKVIECILERAYNVTFSFSTDNIGDERYDVFHNINYTANKVKGLALHRGEKDVKFTLLDNRYYSNGGMAVVEEYLAKGKKRSNAISNSVNIISCNSLRDEAIAAANIIAKEVSANGYRYKDFILVARNTDDYAVHVDRECKNNNIAYFRDSNVRLSDTLLSKFIVNLMSSASSVTTDKIFALIKSGLIEVSDDEVAELENYTFIWDIKGPQWLENWKMSVNGLKTDSDNEHDKIRLENLNCTRKKTIELISAFKNDFCGTPKERINALFKCLTKFGTDVRLGILCDKLKTDGDNYNASLLMQSWNAVVSVWNSIVKIADDTPISSSDFIEMFLTASESFMLSNIPQMLDEVTFGSADRIRPSKPKISIILGANQGVFPAIKTTNGIFAPSDVEKIKSVGIDLNDDVIKSAIEENYLVYSMVCCPTDKAYILYSKFTPGGDELKPSTFVTGLLDNFTDIKVKEFALDVSGEFVPHTAKSALSEMGIMPDTAVESVKAALCSDDIFKDRIKNIAKEQSEINFSISPEVSKSLFGQDVKISASKFDTFHKCKLSYLLRYGFRVSKLEKADLNVLQRGTIAHFVLENLVNRYYKELANLTPAQISAEVDILIDQYLSSVSGSDMVVNARFVYLLERISRSVKEVIYHLSEEFAQSDFTPSYCELTIGDGGDVPKIEYLLSDGNKAVFEGKIDRVDLYNNNVRIVDYKTGRMSFVLSDTLVGLNMQMLLYLRAFIKNGNELVNNARPAGILYMPASKLGNTKSFRMNGLISDNEDVIRAMEKENMGKFVPKKTNKSNDYVSEETFGLIFSKIDHLMTKMGDTVKEGQFCADPTDGAKTNACAYCDFATICRSSDMEHRQAVKYSNEETVAKLKEEMHYGVQTDL